MTLKDAQFNGSTGYVRVAHSSVLNITGAISVIARVYIAALPPAPDWVIVSKEYIALDPPPGEDSAFPFAVYIESTGKVSIYWHNGTDRSGAYTVDGAVTAGQWNRIAISVNATRTAVTFAVNGVIVATEFQPPEILGSVLGGANSDDMTIGAEDRYNGPRGYLAGKMADIHLYNRQLSNAELTGPSTAPSDYIWMMDFETYEGSVIQGLKASGFELNGTIVGGVTIVDADPPAVEPSIIKSVEDWLIEQLAALEYGGSAVFRKVERWKHQIKPPEGSGKESFTRYSPFAFVLYYATDVFREGDYDLRQKLRFAVLIGKESKEDGVARVGSGSELGIDKIRDLVIAALDKQHPGTGILCDPIDYAGETESVNTPRQYALEMYFECNYITD